MNDNIRDYSSYPLHDAIKNGDMNKLEELLKSGKYKDDTKDSDGETATDLAVQLRNCFAVKLLLRCGSKTYDEIKLSEKSKKALALKDQDHNDKESILFDAVQQKNKDVIRALVFWDAKPDRSNFEHYGPLYRAMKDPVLISFLLNLVIHFDKITTLKQGWCNEIVEFLKGTSLENDDNPFYDSCPLEYAIRNASVEMVEFILQHKGIHHGPPNYLKEAITRNSVQNALHKINLLIKHGASINYTDSKNNTPLHTTVWDTNKFEVLCLLLYHGANVHAVNLFGTMPIQQALLRERERFFKVLLFCMPDVSLNDFQQQLVSLTDTNDTNGIKVYLLDFINNVKRGGTYLDLEEMLYYCTKRFIAGLHSDVKLRKNTYYTPEIKNCMVTCARELSLLKKTNICEDVTFFDVLHANKRRLVSLVKKPEVRKAFVHFETERFPIYTGILDRKLLEGILCEPFYDTMLDEWSNIFRVPSMQLPDHILEKILSYLSISDMINWRKATKQPSSDFSGSSISNVISKIIGSVFCSTLNLFS